MKKETLNVVKKVPFTDINYLEEVIGERIIIADVPCFIAQGRGQTDWGVFHFDTGLFISNDKTKKLAIKKTEKVLDNSEFNKQVFEAAMLKIASQGIKTPVNDANIKRPIETKGLQKEGELSSKEALEVMKRTAGFMLGMLSKGLLEDAGCVVDFRINGESIEYIEKLEGLDISERIKLAVKEERYEDAHKLKSLLDAKNTHKLNK